MQKIFYIVLGLVILAGLAGGTMYLKNQNQNTPLEQNQIVGNDKDTHDCLGSAGYSWCSATNKCSRPFEELCPDAVFALVASIKSQTGIELQKVTPIDANDSRTNTEFTWNVRDENNFDGTKITGIAFKADLTRANYQKIEDYLNSMYDQDINNVADGVSGGLRGYQIAYMACVLSFEQNEMKTNDLGMLEPVGDSLGVKFNCGYFNPNDMPKIMAEQAIKSFLATKYKKDINDVSVVISKSDDTHMAGSVKFSADNQSEGGLVLAVKEAKGWQVVFDGNGSVDCTKMRQDYKFSDEILVPQFCD